MPSQAMKHLRHLAKEIGPRGSTTAQEKEAATYAFEQFKQMGLNPSWESFMSPVSGWRPFFVGPLFSILAIFLQQVATFWTLLIAMLLMLLIAHQIISELYFRPNLLQKFVQKRESQNVWASIDAKKQPQVKMLLVGHLDSHRTPWVFSTAVRLSFFKTLSTVGMVINFLTPLFVLLILLSRFEATQINVLFPWIWTYRWVTLCLIPIHLAIMVVSFQADQTPFTVGANDNASGAAIVLSLAEQIQANPLAHVEVWATCTGCEEVGIHGMQAFLKQHAAQLNNTLGISIDNVGGQGDGVCFTSKEGILFQLKPSPLLFSMATELAEKRPSFNAYTRPFTFLHTDGTCMMVNGIPTLSFVGLTQDGRLPHWHQISDTFENITPKSVEQTEAFILALLRNLDVKFSGELQNNLESS